MGKYGKAAILATNLLVEHEAVPPRLAWTSAVKEVFPSNKPSQSKGCPRDAFLALCGMGVLGDVSAGSYTRSVKNKGYVERALAEIRSNPDLATDQKALWFIATEGTKKVENSQMDVLATLFLNGHIK